MFVFLNLFPNFEYQRISLISICIHFIQEQSQSQEFPSSFHLLCKKNVFILPKTVWNFLLHSFNNAGLLISSTQLVPFLTALHENVNNTSSTIDIEQK